MTTSSRSFVLMLVAVFWVGGEPRMATAQNDWQFPDPRFGALVGKSGPPTVADERRYRRDISPPTAPPQRSRSGQPTYETRRGRFRRR